MATLGEQLDAFMQSVAQAQAAQDVQLSSQAARIAALEGAEPPPPPPPPPPVEGPTITQQPPAALTLAAGASVLVLKATRVTAARLLDAATGQPVAIPGVSLQVAGDTVTVTATAAAPALPARDGLAIGLS